MLTEILETNKGRLLAANSYLCPCLDHMINLFRKLEENDHPQFLESVKHSAYSKGDYLVQEGKPVTCGSSRVGSCAYSGIKEAMSLRYIFTFPVNR